MCNTIGLFPRAATDKESKTFVHIKPVLYTTQETADFEFSL
jgi:hypothetical protein